MTDLDCVFCNILTQRAPATIVRQWPEAIAIVPLRPCVPGHLLVIPRVHFADAGEDPYRAGQTMMRAAELMAELAAANLITSKGTPATQTQFHLHIHVLPRAEGDGLLLPWSKQLHAPQGGDR